MYGGVGKGTRFWFLIGDRVEIIGRQLRISLSRRFHSSMGHDDIRVQYLRFHLSERLPPSSCTSITPHGTSPMSVGTTPLMFATRWPQGLMCSPATETDQRHSLATTNKYEKKIIQLLSLKERLKRLPFARAKLRCSTSWTLQSSIASRSLNVRSLSKCLFELLLPGWGS